MNKFKYFILGFLFCLILSTFALANESLLEVYISKFPILIDNKTYTSELPILNYQGRTYLPLREFATVTGNNISFANNTIVIGTKNDDSSKVYITPTGSKYHYSNTCNGGTYTESSLSTAIEKGLTPCEKCVNTK